MKNLEKETKRLFDAKKARRKELAHLSIEEKIHILVQLQKIASPVYHARGIDKQPWKL